MQSPYMLKITMLGLALAAFALVVAMPAANAETIMSPLKQLQQGVAVADIQCNDEKILLKSSTGTIACVYPDTAERLALRGWDVLPQSEPITNVPESGDAWNASETAQNLLVSDHVPANENQTSVYEPLYYVADHKITLSGVEKKITDPSGIIFPITTGDAENIAMPRLASGIGDRLILPAVNTTAATWASYVTYETEMGNKFRTVANHKYPDAIQRIEYYIYTNVGYYEYEEFFASFMDNAGLPFDYVSYATTTGSVYGGYSSMWFNSFIDYTFIKPQLVLHFDGWIVGDINRGELLPRTEIEKRAFGFAAKYSDVLDEERCQFEPIGSDDERVRYDLEVHAGVPIYSVIVGHCTAHGTKSMSVAVEATAGEIVWFNSMHMKDGWIDMLDIPESAKVRGSERHD